MGRILLRPDTLDHGYVPERLPTRENIRRELLDEIRWFYGAPGGFRGILIHGAVGSGKTVLARRICEDLKGVFGDDIITCYVNCRFSGRIYRVLAEIARQISEDLPSRGLSRDEFIELIFLAAKERSSRMLIVLDEIDALFKGEEAAKTNDALYSISRYAEGGRHSGLSMVAICISRDIDFVYKWLDEATRASLIKSTKYLEPYKAEDLFEILSYRASLAFRLGSVDDDILRQISRIVYTHNRGNARTAIDLLRIAGEIAEMQGDDTIKAEHLRLAIREYAPIPSVDIESLHALGRHKLLLLLAIVEALKNLGGTYVTKQQVQEFYRELCYEYNENPRKNTQTWRYLKELEYELGGLLDVCVSGKNQKGRSTRIAVNAPLDCLENTIRRLLEGRRLY